MATAIDHILDLLPHTFRARPRPTALHSLADAFGGELLSAGNALAEVLRAHWVDHADRGQAEILDLALIAALYGLKPRESPFPEESVEQFRDHLKRYVRTFLDGTSTVRGVLRVSAETLGLRIDDDEAHIDAWWRRADDSVTTVGPLLDDAARVVLGFARAEAAGTDSVPATIAGPVLPATIDLRGHSTLVLSVDAGGETEIDVAASAADPSAVTPAEVVAAIEAELPGVAALEDGRLVLRSPTAGAAGRLEVHDPPADAAPVLLGLAPRGYRGRPETTARIVGAHDLSLGVELGGARYLRGVVDGATTIEPDLDPARTGTVALQDVIDAINNEIPHLADEAEGRLVLESRAPGASGSLAVQAPAAHDAAGVLLGPVPRVAVGRDASPALLRGLADLSDGLSLTPGLRLRVEVDGAPAVDVDLDALAGPSVDPNAVAQLLSAALAPAACAFDGRFLRLVSGERGTAGTLVLPPLPADEDAAGPLFGVGPRVFRGTDATPARLEATVELEGETDLGAAYRLALAVDGGAPVTVDLRAGAADAHHVTRAEVRDAINAALGADVAALEGRRLALASPTEGSASRLEVLAREETVRRRFVTRAAVADDAAGAILGFQRADARGTPPGLARIVGTLDLSRGADLSHGRFLRIAVDGAPPRDVDCIVSPSGVRLVPRPRAALLEQVVAAINDAFADLATEEYPGPASDDGVHLVLTSPTPGGDGSIVLSEPRGQDALDAVLGVEPDTYRGRDATRVTFTGAADLSGGVDLTAASLVSVGVDGDPVEVACAGADPAHTTAAEITGAINSALGKFVAHTDGRRILLVSPTTGATSRIVFAVPSGPDATRAIFGVSAPREYFAPAAEPARVDGLRDLSAGADLHVARHLRLSIDGAPPIDIDVAAGASDASHVTADEVKEAINRQAHFDLARVDGGHVVLETATKGSGSRITLLPFSTGDARAALLGDAPSEVHGADAQPARVEGTAKVDEKPKMLGPADLSLGATLRVAVDGGRAVDIRVAGEDPAATTLAEAVDAINARLPGLASISDNYQLLLTSPTRGPDSRLQVLPARVIELAEYPPEPAPGVRCQVVHGGQIPAIDNDGAAEADAEIELVSPGGAAGPGLVDLGTGNRIRLLHALEAGRRVRIRRAPGGGVTAVLLDVDGGEAETIPGGEILTGPAGPHEHVPFRGARAIGPLPGGAEMLVLNDPESTAVVVLRPVDGAAEVAVEVTEARLPTPAPIPAGDEVRIVARLVRDGGRWILTGAGGARIAILRLGPGVHPQPLAGRAVVARGRLFGTGDAATLLASSLRAAFDVSARRAATETEPARSHLWEAVTIGGGGDDGLVAAIENRPPPSGGDADRPLLRAAEMDKGALLVLPRGRSRWMYVECAGPRFDHARFDRDRFPGGACPEAGIFDASRFPRRTDVEQPVFAPWGDNPPAEVSVRWSTHLAGAFEVHLPADLPDFFGGRFNDARFGSEGDAPERFDVVTEPRDDPEFIVDVANLHSRFVRAREVARVPIGWTGVPVPFRRPRVRRLLRGRGDDPARLYLVDPAVPLVVELSAQHPGEFGNGIEVSVRPNGPGRFELTVHYGGGRFECARAVVRGGDRLPPLGADLTAPGPLGLLHARAAGIAFRVAREGAWTPAPEPFTPPKGTLP